ncbi:unnamed protein product [Pedinophyceae sp. YPF-701]|nr:unnamed protein product [Pedinophyceae sp. YPF-701]
MRAMREGRTIIEALVTAPESGDTSAAMDNAKNPALYITLRPAYPKAPALAARRVLLSDLPGFPGQSAVVAITYDHVYPDVVPDDASEKDALIDQICRAGMIVSARLDTDGDAGTRSEYDLVGRVTAPGGECGGESPEVNLRGRGPAGRFFVRQLGGA